MATSCSTEDDDYVKLKRFLCLGNGKGIYRANVQHSHFNRNDVHFVERLLANGRGNDVLECIRDVSDGNKACRQSPTLYAFAFCVVHGSLSVKKKAYSMLNDICRIPTHLFEFISFCKYLHKQKNKGTGWGRSHKVGISRWYNHFADKTERLAYLVTKYKRRASWTHRDVIRMAHLKPRNKKIKTIVKFILNKDMKDVVSLKSSLDGDHKKAKEFLNAVLEAKHCKDVSQLKGLVAEHGLAREHLPNHFLQDKHVWQTLLHTMPMTAILRNLGKMSNLGVFDDEKASFLVSLIQEKMGTEILTDSKIHPLRILFALCQYKKGKEDQGRLSWMPNFHIINILEEAFYTAIRIPPITNKRYLLAVSISNTMKTSLIGSPLSASEAACDMVLSIIGREQHVITLLFENTLKHAFISDISKYDNMNSISAKIDSFRPKIDGTVSRDSKHKFYDWANGQDKFDVIFILTDTLTCHDGDEESRVAEPFDHYTHHIAAENYKRVIIGMTSKPDEVSEPKDKQTLHVIGFDPCTPRLINDFLKSFDEGYGSMDLMEGVELYE